MLSLEQDGGFAQKWAEFRRRLDWHGERLLGELRACWRDQKAILDDQFRQLGEMSIPTVEHRKLAYFRDARREAGRLLLRDAAARWEQARPQQRSLAALETYHSSLNDLVQQLPETASRIEANAAAGRRLSVAAWRRAIPVRRLIRARLERAGRERGAIEERWLLHLLEALRMMVRPWDVYRRTLDGLARGKPLGRFQETQQWVEASQELERVFRNCEAALEALQAHLAHLDAKLFPSLKPAGLGMKGDRALWTQRVEMLRSVEAELRLAAAVNISAVGVLGTLAASLEDIGGEHERLLADIDSVMRWLEARRDGRDAGSLPPLVTVVSPAPVRLAQTDRRFENDLADLPEEAVTVARLKGSLFRRRSGVRRVKPREAARRAVDRNLRPELLRDFDLAQTHHRKAVLAVERVREVVSFAETDEALAAETGALTKEAIEHSLSLLEFNRKELASWQPDFEPRLIRASAEAFAELHLMLGRDWLSVQAYIADRGVRHGMALAGRLTKEMLARSAQRGAQWAAEGGRRFLQRIGWSVKAEAGELDVVTRAVLPRQFTVDVTSIALPALYRRLFRPEPVQDSRFLVGREREIAAIAEARAFWEEGRPAALLVVGERGTGKTSLINCAVQQCLQGIEVTREEFGERVVSEQALRSYLAARLGSGDPAALEEDLARRRRVIVLEEAERTFLRHVNHYGGARALQRLIAATCSSVLWIVVMNSSAFRLLDAALDFGSGFSHRLNTGSASPADIRHAILLRHNLSGLRLEFTGEGGDGGRLAGWLAKLQGADRTPEDQFFAALGRESGGVFRTAFDLWLAHIESIEAGALYMRPLKPPDLTQVISEFDQDDLFTLAAVLQHGSLTPEEHATVFQLSLPESRARIDELAAREVLDTDPQRGGFRVRPHAMRLVREALYRRNLL